MVDIEGSFYFTGQFPSLQALTLKLPYGCTAGLLSALLRLAGEHLCQLQLSDVNFALLDDINMSTFKFPNLKTLILGKYFCKSKISIICKKNHYFARH